MSEPSLTPRGPAPPSGKDPQVSRRRLLQGGLAAAPVLMTLVSRPVLAQRVQTPSAFCSGNKSALGTAFASSGQPPDYWKQPYHFGSWPPPYRPTGGNGAGLLQAGLSTSAGAGGPQATFFDQVFTPHYPGKTLLDVLDLGGGPPNDVARYAVAVLLNVASGRTPVISVNTVKGIWGEYITKGYFEPIAGVYWGDALIVQYLASTLSA